MHAKLVKSDYHGAIVTGALPSFCVCVRLLMSVPVTEAKNPSLLGISGIVIHETENAFRVVTKNNQTKRAGTFIYSIQYAHACTVLPKQNSIFTFAVPLYSALPPGVSSEAKALETLQVTTSSTVLDRPHLLFTLYANQFRFRASERAGRKFKAKETIEL